MRIVGIAFVLITGIHVLPPPLVRALPPIAKPPQLIRITGTFFDSRTETGKQLPTLEVSLGGEKHILYVRDVRSLTSNDQGMHILRNLGAFLSLSGPPEVLSLLISKAAQQEPFQLEGRLYIGERTLALTAVEFAGTYLWLQDHGSHP
jgi:hypothetical protein